MVANSFSGFILFNVCLLKKKKIFSDQCKVWNKVIMNQELYNHLKSVLHSLCFHIFHLSHSVVFRLSSRLLATYPGPSSFWRGDVDWEHLDNLHDCEKRILISVSKLWTPTILQRSFTSHDFTGNPKFWRPLMFQTYPLGGIMVERSQIIYFDSDFWIIICVVVSNILNVHRGSLFSSRADFSEARNSFGRSPLPSKSGKVYTSTKTEPSHICIYIVYIRIYLYICMSIV